MKSDNPLSTVQTILLAVVVLGVAVVGATTELLAGDLAERVLMVLLGGMLVLYGNAVPKALRPLSEMRCVPATEQRLRRLTGWLLVLTGLSWAVSWIALPVDAAEMVTLPTAAACTLLVAGVVGWCLFARRRARSAES